MVINLSRVASFTSACALSLFFIVVVFGVQLFTNPLIIINVILAEFVFFFLFSKFRSSILEYFINYYRCAKEEVNK